MAEHKMKLKFFKDLEEKFLKTRDNEKKKWVKEIKRQLKPYYKIEINDNDYFNNVEEFHFIISLKTKLGNEIELAIDDPFGGWDWSCGVYIYKELPDEIENKLTYIEDEDSCIYKSDDVNRTLKFLIEIAKKKLV